MTVLSSSGDCLIPSKTVLFTAGGGVPAGGGGALREEAGLRERGPRALRVEPQTLKGVVATEAGSYSRLTESCMNQRKAQGPARTCDKSKEGGS